MNQGVTQARPEQRRAGHPRGAIAGVLAALSLGAAAALAGAGAARAEEVPSAQDASQGQDAEGAPATTAPGVAPAPPGVAPGVAPEAAPAPAAGPANAPPLPSEPAAPQPAAPASEPAPEPPAAPSFDLAAEARRVEAADPEARADAMARIRAAGEEHVDDIAALIERRRVADERLLTLLAELDPERARRLERGGKEPWYLPKVRRAIQLMDEGDHLTAIHHLNAVLTLEPRCPVRGQIRDLIVRAKELLVQASIVEARMVPERVLVHGGEHLVFTVEVENVSDRQVALSRGEPYATLHGALELELFSMDAATGAMRRNRHVRRVDITLDALLEPGETVRRTVSLKPLGDDDPRVFRRASVRGAFRPTVLVHGGEERVDRFLPLFPVEIAIVDESRMAIAAEPLRILKESLDAARAARTSAERVAAEETAAFAALFAPSRQREAVIDALMEAVRDPADPAGRAAMLALSGLAEEPVLERPRWLRWDEERRR